MPRAFSLKVDGVTELQRKITSLIAALDEPIGVGQIFLGVAVVVRDDARGRAPVKTGNLRANIFAGIRRTKVTSAVVGCRVKKVPYCWYVEFGTPRSPAHPFLRPAAIARSSDGLEIAARGLTGLIEKAVL